MKNEKLKIRNYLLRFGVSLAILVIFYLGIGFIFDKEFFISYVTFFGNRKNTEAAIKDTLILYNKILTDLYASDGKTLRLNDFPTVKRLRHELYRDLDSLRAHKLLLVYDMANIDFIEIKMPTPWTAEAVAYEEWNYVYQRLPSRETAQSIKGMGQGFKYFLQRQKGQWVVTDYNPINIKPNEKKDDLYY